MAMVRPFSSLGCPTSAKPIAAAGRRQGGAAGQHAKWLLDSIPGWGVFDVRFQAWQGLLIGRNSTHEFCWGTRQMTLRFPVSQQCVP
jgi:hypothetical protein